MKLHRWLSSGVLLLPCSTMAFAGWSPRSPHSQQGAAARRSSWSSLQQDATLNGERATITATNDGNDEASSASMEEEENIKTIDLLSLQSIRNSLIRQEETIIFALIERAQYRHNPIVYEKGGFGNLGTPAGSTPVETGAEEEELSFLEYMLVGTEALHCGVRRYTSPEEHAFFPERLPSGQMEALPRLQYPQDLLSNEGGASDVNFNKILLQKYIDIIVPSLTRNGDDEQHGSTVLADIAVLQALSRRVHYGKFVAESKYVFSNELFVHAMLSLLCESCLPILFFAF